MSWVMIVLGLVAMIGLVLSDRLPSRRKHLGWLLVIPVAVFIGLIMVGVIDIPATTPPLAGS